MDVEMLKEIPGYKAILKAVLKSQIQMLVEQLSAQTEEESVLLTVSLTDGSLHHLGSLSGKDFLEGREEIKSQFLFHCLNRKTRSPVPNQDQVFMPHLSSPMPQVTSPVQHVTSPPASGQFSPESRPAKKPRRTLPLPTGRGRGRKPQSQINAGAKNIPRPLVSAPATISRPPEEPDTAGYTAGETEKAPEPDLITVKAEDFELNIDLNDSATKLKEAPVDSSVISDIMNIVNQPQKSVPMPTSSTQSYTSDQGDLDMNVSTGDVKDSNTSMSGLEGDSSLNLKESIMPVKTEAPDDDLEITGSEPGASQAMYMVAGSSGTMGSQSWAPMGMVGMEPESFTSGAEGQEEESFDYGNQTSGSDLPVSLQYLGEQGFIRIPEPGRPRWIMKRKLNQKTIAEKYEAIMEVETGEISKTEVARRFNVPLSTLSGWLKEATSIKEGYIKFGPGRCTMRKGNFQELEAELFKWCVQMLEQNVQLNGPFILEKARALAVELQSGNDLKLTTGWLDRFKERHGLKYKKFHGITLSR